jgi:hypothetical protein
LETLREGRNHFGQLGVNKRKISHESVDWTPVAQDRDQWRILVNTVMNHGIS